MSRPASCCFTVGDRQTQSLIWNQRMSLRSWECAVYCAKSAWKPSHFHWEGCFSLEKKRREKISKVTMPLQNMQLISIVCIQTFGNKTSSFVKQRGVTKTRNNEKTCIGRKEKEVLAVRRKRKWDRVVRHGYLGGPYSWEDWGLGGEQLWGLKGQKCRVRWLPIHDGMSQPLFHSICNPTRSVAKTAWTGERGEQNQ